MKYRFKSILEKIKEKKFTFFLIIILYDLMNILLNKTHLTYKNIIYNHTIFYIVSFVLLNYIFIPILISTTIILSIKKIKDIQKISKKGSSISIIAIFGTLLGGACPYCFVGLFPAFVGLFGSTINLGNLPLQGFEIQIISSIILLISIYYLSNPTICKIKKN